MVFSAGVAFESFYRMQSRLYVHEKKRTNERMNKKVLGTKLVNQSVHFRKVVSNMSLLSESPTKQLAVRMNGHWP